MKYYLWINDTQEGPFEDSEILQKLSVQSINLDTLAYEVSGSNPNWIKVSEIPEIRSAEVKFATKPQPSSARWYYLNDRQQVAGPVRAEGLSELAGMKEISKETLICSEGTEIWIPYAEVFPQTNISTTNTSPRLNQNTANPSEIGRSALLVGFGILASIYILNCRSTSSLSAPTKNKSSERVAEGEALLEEMEKYNANPVRTQAERKDIERRVREYENKVYGTRND